MIASSSNLVTSHY